MLTCKGTSRLISECQERSLGFSERWSLRLHLWICDNCRRFERQMKLLRLAMYSSAENVETGLQGPNLSPESEERIRRVLLEQD